MEPLEQQVSALITKVDALYQVIQQLEHKVSQVLSASHVDNTKNRDNLQGNGETGSYQFRGNISLNTEFEHKDVLVDGIYLDSSIQGGDKHLTTEIQIQRLTAQLTAAYNRIAALEEQLLLKRIHS
jgi:hypothetical protein